MAGEFLTAGTALKYGDATVSGGVVTIPSVWTTIPNVTSTPDLNASPDTVDVTDLADTVYKRAIQGLIDISMLEFEANYTAALVSAVATAATDPGTGKTRAFCIEFPATKERVWWVGSITAAMPAGAAVGEAQTTTLAISVESDFAKVTYV